VNTSMLTRPPFLPKTWMVWSPGARGAENHDLQSNCPLPVRFTVATRTPSILTLALPIELYWTNQYLMRVPLKSSDTLLLALPFA